MLIDFEFGRVIKVLPVLWKFDLGDHVSRRINDNLFTFLQIHGEKLIITSERHILYSGLVYLHRLHLHAAGIQHGHDFTVGQGIIGADALRAVVRHPLLQDRPFILETPNDDTGYKSEIETVISWMI